jgi:heptosyltransferase-2
MFNRIKSKLNRCWTSAGLNRAAGAVLTSGRRPKCDPASIAKAKRILVLKPDGIGDVILVTGFLRSLRKQCPAAHITLAVRQHSKELVDNACFGDEVMIWNEAWCGPELRRQAAFDLARSARAQWKAHPLDWVLIPRSGWDHANAAMYAWWSGAANVCAHEFFCSDRDLNRHGFVNHLIPTPTMVHETEFHRSMLRYLKLDSEIQPQLEIPAAAKKKVEALLAGKKNSTRGNALGIGASHASKRWPAENFKTVAQHLIAKSPGTPLFLIGGSEDREVAQTIRTGLGTAIVDVTGTLSISETASLLQRCDVYVGNDSGPIHLAGAVGCAVVEMSKHPASGSSQHECSPVRFGPVAKWSQVLQPKAAAPECAAGCNSSSAHCLATITVDEVMKAVAEAFAAVETEKLISA